MPEMVQWGGAAPEIIQNTKPRSLVLIGLSAGGLFELFTLLDGLPPEVGFPIVIVLHLHPDYKSILVQLLTHRTGREVHAAADGKLVRGVIYVAPPDQHVTFEHGEMKLVRTAAIKHLRPSIDVLFTSAASDRTLHTVAVLLSGAGCDGTLGISAVREAGGATIAQTPDSALFRSMPASAIATGCIDFVLPSGKIGEMLLKLTTATETHD
jgi:two-component system, chemotaxis family, CheB/CheR fusion protein